jgi:hypothetical protein
VGPGIAGSPQLSTTYSAPKIRGPVVPALLIYAAFGPYLLPSVGVRLEHIVIYTLLVPAVSVLVLRRDSVLGYPPLLAVFLLWVFATIWTATVTLLGDRYFASLPTAISYFENYLQPVVVTLVLAALIGRPGPAAAHHALIRACGALVTVLSINSVLALTSLVVDMRPLMFYFTGPEAVAGQGTVWERAASMGRFSGVFNQPLESGIAYSLGLLAWGFRHRAGISGWSHRVGLVLLLIGGALSVSKVFLLGGLPLFLLYVVRYRAVLTLTARVDLRLAILVAASTLAVAQVVRSWTGFDYLLRLLRFSGGGLSGILDLYTAGRFGGGETHVKYLFIWTWREAPVHGFGFAASPMLDSGYAEFMVQGGIVGLACYVGVLATLVWLGVSRLRSAPEEGRLLLACSALLIGASIGAPALTANRVSTVIWALLAAICAVLQARGRRPGRGGGNAHAAVVT